MDILVNGVLLGLGYCLIAVGMALILGVAKVFDLTYAIYYTIAPYAALTLIRTLGPITPLWLVFIISVGVSVAFALVIHAFLILPIQKQHLVVFVSTIAVGMVIQELLIFKAGSEPIHLPMILNGSTNIFGVWVTNQKLLVGGVTGSVLATLWVFLSKTRLGLAIRVTAEQPEAMKLAGGNIKMIFLFTAILAAVVASIGGLLLSPIYPPHPYEWLDLLIIAFAVMVLGGLGNIWACLPAALILGISEVAVVIYVPFGGLIKRTVGLIIIFIILVFRPTGLFGVKGWEESQE
jgi:branched-chain amino acid transport system permease protein